MALKQMQPPDAHDWKRAWREVDMTASMRHANLMPLCEAYHHGGCVYIAMDYMDDGNLTSELAFRQPRREKLHKSHIAHVVREVLCGVRMMHGMGRLHRELKSDNVLVKCEGEVRIADFWACAQLMGRGGHSG